ncbi:Xanthine dehydrogenase/oxidase [Lamellibrachia satsuma]|nr:Xanthine dehydrogenase/oxidase [Lamellibrachia satsuma]
MSSYNSDPTIRANTSKRVGFSSAVNHVKVKMASSTVPVKSDAMQTKLVFYVNGRKVVENNPNPEELLGKYLRNELRLVGTKKACGQGGCGACTVMVSRINRQQHKIQHYAINSCITPICYLHGLAVTTVEGVGSRHDNIHPVQERLALNHGTQCGFCTPGMVMSMYALLRSHPLPSVAQMERALEGNLCRCTGYRPILDAFRNFTKEAQCAMGDACCKLQKKDEDVSNETSVGTKEYSDYLPYHPTQEPIFPSELQLSTQLDEESLMFISEKATWVVIDSSKVPEMKEIKVTDHGLMFGSSVTLSEMEDVLQETIEQLPEHKTRLLSSLLVKLGQVGSVQLRNSATLGGHIMAASTSSDLNSQFLASRSCITVASPDGTQRQVAIDEAFFVACQETVLQPQDILLSLLLPYSSQREYIEGFKLHKAASRKEEIVCVNAAMRVVFKENTDIIEDIALSFGGVRSTSMLATNTQHKLIGRKWDDKLVTTTSDLLAAEIRPPTDGQSDTYAYKQTLAVSLFFKFYLNVQMKLHERQIATVGEALHSDPSATTPFPHETARGVQVYEEVSADQSSSDAVGRSLPVKSALNNALGKSVFIDDMPPYQAELYMALVTSKEAHANIVSVTPSRAFQMAGVVDYINAADIVGEVERTEEIFATKEVLCRGQTIGAIVARSQTEALEAANAVDIEYEPLPAVISIQQAIDAGSLFSQAERTLTNGDLTAGFGASDVIIESEVYVGGQEHFYMETQSCVAVPRGEDGEMEIFSSTQFPTGVQTRVADVLGVPSNKVVCHVKRVGRLQRPVRCVLERSTDMAISGQRRPVLAKYKVGCTNDGRILALDISVFANCGSVASTSEILLETLVLNMDNGYKIPNLRVRAHACRTNLPTFQAFRGFGCPQGMFVLQTVLQHIAETLKLPPDQVSELNLYKEADLTPYNQMLEDCHVRQCWRDLMQRSSYKTRCAQVNKFNREHRWKKRGLAIVPIKYPITIAGMCPFLNQHPSFAGEGVDRSVVIVGGYGDASSYTVSYLPHYYTGVPLVTSNIKKSYVSAARLASLTSDDFKQHTEEKYTWRHHTMRA